jgi:hypothetical protein
MGEPPFTVMYIYRSLSNQQCLFRVPYLLPALRIDAALECRLQEIEGISHNTYEALSYSSIAYRYRAFIIIQSFNHLYQLCVAKLLVLP